MDSEKRKSTVIPKWIYIVLALIVVVMCLCPAACTTINKKFNLEDDHLAEEILESLIEERTNIDIDLSPASPERSSLNRRS